MILLVSGGGTMPRDSSRLHEMAERLRAIELRANAGESIHADDALFMLAIIARLRSLVRDGGKETDR